MKITKNVILTAVSVLASAAVTAASDGTPKSAAQGGSTGNAVVSVTIPTMIVIRDMDDLTTEWDGASNIQLTDATCVGMNHGGSNYGLTATGDGAGNAFTLSETGGSTLPYAVSWSSTSTSATSGTSLTSGSSTSFSSGTAQGLNCSSNNATLIVDIDSANLENAATGTYSGTLSVNVSPL